MNTTNLIKFGASAAGALLILLFANWGASALYGLGEETPHVAEGAHAPQGYVIAAMDSAETSGGDATAAAPEENFADVYAAADPAKGEKQFKACKACHKLADGENSTGPSLYGVVDRPIGTEAGFSYSDALLAHQGDTWTPENLNAWLTDPKAYADGTKMNYKGMKKIGDRANLIAYLATNPG